MWLDPSLVLSTLNYYICAVTWYHTMPFLNRLQTGQVHNPSITLTSIKTGFDTYSNFLIRTKWFFVWQKANLSSLLELVQETFLTEVTANDPNAVRVTRLLSRPWIEPVNILPKVNFLSILKTQIDTQAKFILLLSIHMIRNKKVTNQI